jgi:hypothetical protein
MPETTTQEQKIENILGKYDVFPKWLELKNWLIDYYHTEEKRSQTIEEKDRFLLQNYRESLSCCIDSYLTLYQIIQILEQKTIDKDKIQALYQNMQDRLKILDERRIDLTGIYADNIQKNKTAIDTKIKKYPQIYAIILNAQTEIAKHKKDLNDLINKSSGRNPEF